ncbi:MAG: PhoH family protein [Planctomycetota bacterium]
MKTEKTLEIERPEDLVQVFGTSDRYIRQIRNAFGVMVIARGDTVKVIGESDQVDKVMGILESLLGKVRRRGGLDAADVEALIRDKSDGHAPVELRASHEPPASRDRHREGHGGVHIKGALPMPQTEGQGRYLRAMEEKEIVFAIGPAGTGKTYLAVAEAVKHLREGQIRRLVLVRPAVEAGERLGFLPGSFQEKVNPYLRPLYDALGDLLDYNQLRRLMETEVIEVAPLAYMRGRTLNQSFIILDEAQNTTSEQMKMFLTRMGNASRIVVTGDITQVDLPSGKTSGLIEIQGLLKHIQGLEFVYLTRHDIVRHPLVQEIVDAYDDQGKQGKRRH